MLFRSGQMMERVELADPLPRLTEEEVFEKHGSWAATGRRGGRKQNTISSLELLSSSQEKANIFLQNKYKTIKETEQRAEMYMCDDAEYFFVAYGSSARICQKSVELLREEGVKVGLIRLITLFPFPTDALNSILPQAKGFLAVEMSCGQMVEDVKLAINCAREVHHFGRFGGEIHSPEEVVASFKQHYCNR